MASERILIIDDSPIEARFASKLLQQAGYDTSVVHNGTEALAAALKFRPDLILLDVTMPGMDGYVVTEQLKAEPRTRNITVVLYTIRDEMLDVLRGVEAGADDFIIKSLSGDDFLNRVKKILTERELGRVKPTESVSLPLIQPLAKMPDIRELVQLLYETFNKHFREAVRVYMGTHATSLLIERAVKKVVLRFPYFERLNLTSETGVSFDPATLENVTAASLVEGFHLFTNELSDLVTKMTRARVQGAKEARGVAKGISDMVSALQGYCEQIETLPEQPAAAPLEPKMTVKAEPPAKESPPMRITKVYTRTGDQGETHLVGGARVSKASPRVEAFGEIDEANTLIGLSRCELTDPDIGEMLRTVQNELFTVGADLSSPEEVDGPRITPEMVINLEQSIDQLNEQLSPLEEFILPSGDPAAVLLHMARGVVRRAERRIVRLNQEVKINGQVIAYMNRLSDLLFVLARTVNHRRGVNEELADFSRRAG